MKRALQLAAIVTFVAGTVFGQSAKSTAADLREIERLEAEWNRINEVSDAAGKERLLTDDSYHVGPSGRLYNKSQDVEAMRVSSEQKQASGGSLKFMISNKRIRLYENVAVVTATGTSVTTQDGKERKGGWFRVIHVWERRNGEWLLSVDQVTGIAK
jgi:ketosteroid isomerase-like protein